MAGLAIAAAVSWRWPILDERGRTALLAYAAFGLTLLLLASLSYLNTPGVDEYFDFQINLVMAAVVAVVAVLGRWQLSRSSSR